MKIGHAKPGPGRTGTDWLGVAFVFLAALLWSLNGAFIKTIHRDGAGPGGVTIAFYRSLFAGAFLLPLAWGRFRTLKANCQLSNADCRLPSGNGDNRPAVLERKRRIIGLFNVRPAAFAGVVSFALMTTSFVVANTLTEAGNAIILLYTSTFWVAGLSPLILRERASNREWPVLGLAMLGVGIIFAGNADTDLAGLMTALAAGLSYGLLTMILRLLRTSDSAAVTVVNNLGTAVLLLPVVAVTGGLPISARDGFLLVLMGAVQLGLPYYLFSLGLGRVPAHQAALVAMAEPILVPVWTYLTVGEMVPLETVIGGGVILLALVGFIVFSRTGTAEAV
jgi:drug/metabolite transporter (DMT)-like permease